MSKFTPTTNRNGACEICGDTSGKCRRIEELHLCMTFADAKLGEIQNGYKCIKPDRGKGWASFVLDDRQDWDEQDRQRWLDEVQQRRQQQATLEAERKARSLSAVERDRLYEQLLNELTLHPDDRADLIRRGLTQAQIDRGEFRSVERYQQLQAQHPELLPGISANGRSLVNTQAGYLCILRDKDGLRVACQVRLRVLAEGDKNRYRWLSQEDAPAVLHLYRDNQGELPLTVHRPPGTAIGIALAEGTGAKPLLTADRLSRIVVGAAGGQWSSSPGLLRETLDALAAELKTRTIQLFPDAGDVCNPQVMPRWERLIKLLRQWQYTVRIGWWGQITKNDCDIDELEPEQLAQIRYVPFALLRSIAIEHGGLPDPKQAKSAEPIEEPRSGPTWELWRRSRKFSAEHHSQLPYFAAPTPHLAAAIGIRSGTGTGKTQWLIRQVIRELGDRGFLAIGYRNSLLIQFAEQVGLLTQSNWYHLQQDLKGSPDLHLIRDPNSKILCCIDSLLYFEPQDFDGKIIILDEIESIINQLLKADTSVSFQREKVKERFAEMLRRCDRVIFLDGHLRDSTVEYLRKLAGGHKVFHCYHNQYQGNKGNVKLLEGVETAKGLKLNDRSPVLGAILSHSGRFVVGSDSQEELQALERKLMEQGRKTLRFDGTTASKPWAKAFLRDPASYIQIEGIEVLLYSPSAEAGLSIDLRGYFSDAYFLFFGVITTNAQLQMLARVRDPGMEIHIACPLVGLPSESVSKSALPEQLAIEMKQYVLDCALASLSGLTVEDVALKLAEQLVNFSADAHYEHELFLTAIDNHERANLRDCLREALEESGYQVESVIGQPSESVEAIATQRREIRQEKARLTVEAANITTAEADKKSRSFEATEQDKYAISKRRLLDRLPGIETATYTVPVLRQVEAPPLPPPASADTADPAAANLPVAPSEPATPTLPTVAIVEMVQKPVFDADFVEQVRFHDRRLISQLELRYLIEHPHVAQSLQQMRWHKRLSIFTDPDEPDSSKRLNLSTYHSRWLKIHRLLELGIEFFLQPGATWHAQTPEAKAFWQAGKHPRHARAIGRSVGRSTVCGYIGEVLKSIGIKTESTYCHTLKTYVYRLDEAANDAPIVQAIYAAVERRFEEMMGDDLALDWEKVTQEFEEVQTQLQQAVESRSLGTDLFKESQTGDRDFDLVQASAEYAIEAIKFGAQTIAEIFASWTAEFAAAVRGWLQTYASSSFEQMQQLCPVLAIE